jgi:hypothetical protein
MALNFGFIPDEEEDDNPFDFQPGPAFEPPPPPVIDIPIPDPSSFDLQPATQAAPATNIYGEPVTDVTGKPVVTDFDIQPAAGTAATTAAPAAPRGQAVDPFAQIRANYVKELGDPQTLAEFYNLTYREVDAEPPEAQQAFMETLFNRAYTRGQTLRQAINDRAYYPKKSYRPAEMDPDRVNRYTNMAFQVIGGSDVSRGATGNASGTVSFNKGPQTAQYGRERFGTEGPDVGKLPGSVAGMPVVSGPVARAQPVQPGETRPVLGPAHPAQAQDYGFQLDLDPNDPTSYREDGTLKGPGFLGPIQTPDGQIATEKSIGVNINGKETLIPSLVPGLTQAEISTILSGSDPSTWPASIQKKAVAHAQARIAKGLSPFQDSQPAAAPPADEFGFEPGPEIEVPTQPPLAPGIIPPFLAGPEAAAAQAQNQEAQARARFSGLAAQTLEGNREAENALNEIPEYAQHKQDLLARQQSGELTPEQVQIENINFLREASHATAREQVPQIMASVDRGEIDTDAANKQLQALGVQADAAQLAEETKKRTDEFQRGHAALQELEKQAPRQPTTPSRRGPGGEVASTDPAAEAAYKAQLDAHMAKEKDVLAKMGITDPDTVATIQEHIGAQREYLRTLGWMDKMRDIAGNPAQLAPFLSSHQNASQLADMLIAADAHEKGSATPQQEIKLREFVGRSQQDRSTRYNIAATLAGLPSFIGEIMATGGLSSAGEEVALRAGQKALQKMLTEAGAAKLQKSLAANAASRLVTKIAVTGAAKTVGTIPQLPIAMGPRFAAGTMQRIMPELTLTTDQAGGLATAIRPGSSQGQAGQDLTSAMRNSLGDQFVELWSEKTGGALNAVTGAARNQLVKMGIVKALVKANPAKKAAILTNLKKLGQKTNWHGLLGEMGEERIGEVTRALLGVDAQGYKPPSRDQLLTELVAFSVPTVAGHAAMGAARRIVGGKPTAADKPAGVSDSVRDALAIGHPVQVVTTDGTATAIVNVDEKGQLRDSTGKAWDPASITDGTHKLEVGPRAGEAGSWTEIEPGDYTPTYEVDDKVRTGAAPVKKSSAQLAPANAQIQSEGEQPMVEVDLPGGPLGWKMDTARALARVLGLPISWVRSATDTPLGFRGLHHGGRIFINLDMLRSGTGPNAAKPLHLIAAHEIMHALNKTQPRLARKLLNTMVTGQGFADWRQKMRTEFNYRGTEEQMMNELAPEFLAEVLANPTRLRQALGEDVSLMRRAATHIMEVIDSLIRRLGGRKDASALGAIYNLRTSRKAVRKMLEDARDLRGPAAPVAAGVPPAGTRPGAARGPPSLAEAMAEPAREEERVQFSQRDWKTKTVWIGGKRRGTIDIDFKNKTATMTVDGRTMELPSVEAANDPNTATNVARQLLAAPAEMAREKAPVEFDEGPHGSIRAVIRGEHPLYFKFEPVSGRSGAYRIDFSNIGKTRDPSTAFPIFRQNLPRVVSEFVRQFNPKELYALAATDARYRVYGKLIENAGLKAEPITALNHKGYKFDVSRFQPEQIDFAKEVDNPRAIKSVAIRDDKTGKIHEPDERNWTHTDVAYRKVGSQFAPGTTDGYMTWGGEFLDRQAAYIRAQEVGQMRKDKPAVYRAVAGNLVERPLLSHQIGLPFGDETNVEFAREPLRQKDLPFSPFKATYLGTVGSRGGVRGEKLTAETQDFGHEDFGLRHGLNWRYYPKHKSVMWWGKPDEVQRSDVEAWLQKRGQSVEKHHTLFRYGERAGEIDFAKEKDNPRAIRAVAVRDENGKVYAGKPTEIHGEVRARVTGRFQDAEGLWDGFVTNEGEFLNRREAYDRALELGQIRKPKAGDLDALDIEGMGLPAEMARERILQPEPASGKITAGGLWIPDDAGKVVANKPENYISTRHPSSVDPKEDRHNTYLQQDLATILADPPFAKDLADAVRPTLHPKYRSDNPERQLELAIRSKMVFTERTMQRGMQNEWWTPATNQYEGYNKRAYTMGRDFDTDPSWVMGSESSMSPQRPPDASFDMVRRLLRVMHSAGNQKWDARFDKAVRDFDVPIGGNIHAKDPAKAAHNRRMRAYYLEILRGSKFHELPDYLAMAYWAVVFDRVAYGDQRYRMITPTGEYGDWARTVDWDPFSEKPLTKKAGLPAGLPWAPFGNVAKGIEALMGARPTDYLNSPKVSSYKNNKEAPNGDTRLPMIERIRRGDVTVDTHEVNLGHFNGFAADSPEVSDHLGTPGSAITGVTGAYALQADATRRVAEKHNMLPNKLQAGDWTQQQGTLSADAWKDRKLLAEARSYHVEWVKGELNDKEYINKVENLAHRDHGSTFLPAWSREPGPATRYVYGPGQRAAVQAKLSRAGRPGGAAGRGKRGPAAGGVSAEFAREARTVGAPDRTADLPETGKPFEAVLFRGHQEEDPHRAIVAIPTYTDSAQVAGIYARPARGSRVGFYKVKMKNPLVLGNLDEDVVELGDIRKAFEGKVPEKRLENWIRDFDDSTKWRSAETGDWTRLSMHTDVLGKPRDEAYTDTYRVGDDMHFVEMAKAAGYDGIIARGTFTGSPEAYGRGVGSYDFGTASVMEYRPFHKEQAEPSHLPAEYAREKSDHPDKITDSYIRMPDGKNFYGPTHGHALAAMLDEYPKLKRLSAAQLDNKLERWKWDGTFEVGFRTKTGRHLDREEAAYHAIKTRQVHKDEFFAGHELIAEDLPPDYAKEKSEHPDAIKVAAVRDKNGKIHTSGPEAQHAEIYDGIADKIGYKGLSALGPFEDGFLDNSGRFLSREEAYKVGVKLGQIDPSRNDWGGLASAEDIEYAREAEPPPGMKERGFAEQLRKDLRLAEEVRDGLTNNNYTEVPNDLTVDQATAWIADKPVPEVLNMITDRKNGVSPRVRVAAGLVVMTQMNNAIAGLKHAGKSAEAELLINRTIDLGDFMTEYGTEQGQGVQAFAIWNRLTPEGKLGSIKRIVDRSRRSYTAKHQAEIDQLKAEIERLAQEAKTDEERLAELKKLFGVNKVAKRAKPVLDKLIKAAKTGRLTDQVFYDIVSERLGLPKYDRQVVAELTRMALAIDAAPAGIPRNKLVLDMQKYIATRMGFSAGDLAQSIWYGNMLSGFGTHVVNITDTALNVVSDVNGMFLVELVTGKPLVAARIWSNALRGFSHGLLQARRALAGTVLERGKLEGPTSLGSLPSLELARFGVRGGVPLTTGPDAGFLKRAYVGTLRRIAESKPAAVLNLWKYVRRAMFAEDSVMFHAARQARSSLLAYRAAAEEGHRGSALRRRVRELLGQTPEQIETFALQADREGLSGIEKAARIAELQQELLPLEARADAEEFAGEATYQMKPKGLLGRMSDHVDRFAQRGGPANVARILVVPFTRIAANVTNRSLNYTPWGFKRAMFGYSYDEAPLTHDQKALLFVRAAIGTSVMAGAVAAQAAGLIAIHGGGPRDPEKRRQLLEGGWRPWSWQIGNTYISYLNTPLSLGMGFIGNATDPWRYGELDDKQWGAAIAYGFAKMGTVIASQSFLSGMANFFGAIGANPDQSISYLKRLTSGTAGNVLPRLTMDTYKLFDPTKYDANTIMGVVLQNTPFAAAANKATLNAFGEKVETPRTFVGARFVTTMTKDLAWQTVLQKGLKVPVPDKYTEMPDGHRGTKKRQITPDEYHELLSQSGPKIKAWILTRGMSIEDPVKLQDALEAKAKEIREPILDRLRRSARNNPVD